MTLSDFIDYRNRVHALAKNGVHHSAKDLLARTATELLPPVGNSSPPQITAMLARIDSVARHAEAQILDLQHLIENLDAEIQTCIAQHHPRYHAQSRHVYQNQFRSYGADKILDTVVDITADQRSLLRSRIMAHSNWLDTGLMLRPGRDELVESMSAMGILYLFDTHKELLVPAVSRFPEHHRDKYRDYWGLDPVDLRQLPQQQMRLIVVLNFFNFLPLEMVQQYLVQVTQLLRPGGTVIFTFNDCDHAVNVGFCERSWQCYQPGSEMLALTRGLGLELETRQWFDNGLAWLELRRPGKYRPLRGAPIVTKIHARSK